MACGCGGSAWQGDDGAVPAGNIHDDGYFWPPRRVAPAAVEAAAERSPQWHPDTEPEDADGLA